jgi:hypothetical protein
VSERPAPGPTRARAALLGLLSAPSLLAGCAGGLPLLHPAQTLPAGEVRASAGFSANVASAGFADALHRATVEAASSPNVPLDLTYAKGALVEASVAPGLAPLVGARVGIAGAVEGGLEYTGRAVRADVRRSFELSRHWALSAGGAGSALFYGHSADQALPDVDLGELHGWGADVPILVGYTSDADLYALWLGARGGWEHAEIGALSSVPSVTIGGPSLTATRLWAGGVVGVAVGFRHVHIAMELDVSYANVWGQYAGTQAQISGLSLTPASALWWTF